MIRKSKVTTKEAPVHCEINADLGLDPKHDVPNLECILFEGSPLPVAASAGPDHRLRYVNPAFCRMAGKTREELHRNPVATVAFSEQCLALLDRVYRTGEAVVHAEPEDPEAHPTGRSYTMWPIYDGVGRF